MLSIGDSAFIIFVFLVVGLFLGFVFQGVTVFFRHKIGWNERAYKRVITYEDGTPNPIYSKVINSFERSLKVNKNNKRLFYLMDSKLRGDKPAFLPTHFSSLFAFWSNMFFVIFVVLCITSICGLFGIVLESRISYLILILVIFMGGALYFSDKFLIAFYDAVLNSYYCNCYKKTVQRNTNT